MEITEAEGSKLLAHSLNEAKSDLIIQWKTRSIEEKIYKTDFVRNSTINLVTSVIDELIRVLADSNPEAVNLSSAYLSDQNIHELQIIREIISEYFETKSFFTKPVRKFVNRFFDSAIRKTAAIFVNLEKHKSDALREFEEFVMQTPIPMAILKGEDHRFTLTNKPYEKIVGRQVLGKSVAEAFIAEEVSKFIPLLDEVYETGKPFEATEIPFHVFNEKGVKQTYLIDIGYYPLREISGKIKGIFVTAQDVTANVRARKFIEQRKSEFQEISNSLPHIVFSAGPDGVVTWHNQRWNEFFGDDYSGKEDEIQNPLHPIDVVLARESWQQSIATGQDFQMEYRLKRASDQQYRWHLGRATPTRDKEGKITKWIGTYTDLHDLKNIRQELESTQNDLILAKNVAEIATQAKSAFLANMSHEIRTPLSIIMGFSILLKESELNPSERNKYVEAIIRNGSSLTKIIEDILDLATFESGIFDIEKYSFSIYDLASECVDMFKDKALHQGIYLLLDVDKYVSKIIFSDPRRIRQILINLIGNAVKFTVQGGVMVGIESNTDSNGELQIIISIKDTGIGLAEEQKSKLFQPFMQADETTSRKFGGAGLGLVLSQKLAVALGGNINISECALGKGCTFRLAFPATNSAANKLNIEKSKKLVKKTDMTLKGIKILIVDDLEDNHFLINKLLIENGAIVNTAPDGSRAVAMALSGSYDIIVMDIQMPKMDGYQALAALKAKAYEKPVIALTAHAMSKDHAKSVQAGFAAHLTKPIDAIKLVETILKMTE